MSTPPAAPRAPSPPCPTHRPPPGPRFNRAAVVRALSLALLLGSALVLMRAGLPSQGLAQSEPPPTTPEAELPRGVIDGALLGHSEPGTPVVLLRFQLDDEGQPQGGPIGRTATDDAGGYRFADVPIDNRSVYRIGTRVGGRLIGSDPFTFPRGQQAVTVNLEVPGRSEDASTLRIAELLWVAEPVSAGAWITEVVHLSNGGPDVIDTTRAPLELPLAAKAERFELMRLDAEGAEHERVGPKLLIRGQLAPGTSVVAFRYRVDVPWGALRWERRYDWPVSALRVLAPEGLLTVRGPELVPGAPETFESTTYSGLERRDIGAGVPIALALEGIPLAQWLLLVPLAGFLLLAGGVLWWFLRNRLGREAPAGS